MTICGIPGCNYVRKTGGRSMFRIRRPDLARTPGERKHRQRLTNVMLSIRDFTKGDNIKDLIHKEACCICDNHFAKEDILDYGMKMSLRLGAMPTKNMPFPQCSVPGCHHPNGFRFPKRMRIKKKWIEAINRAGDFGRRKWKPNSKSNVCYQHFLREDFCCDESGKILKMLKPTAVPSIFNTYDPELNSVKFKIKEASLKATMKPKTAQEIMLSLPISSVSQDGEQAYVNNVVMGLTGDTQGPDMVEKLFVTNIRGSGEMPMHNTGMTETTNLKNADSSKITAGLENTKSDSNSEQEPSNTNSLSANHSLHKTVERIPTDKKNGVNENQMVSANPYLDTTQHDDGGLGNNFERNMDPMPPTSPRKDTYPSLNSTNASNSNESCLENGNLISDCETNLSKKSVKYLPGNNDVSNSHGLPLTNNLRTENQMEESLSSNCETSIGQTSLIYSSENTVISNSLGQSSKNPTDLVKSAYNLSIKQSHNGANIDRMDIAQEKTLNSKLNILADKNVSSVTTQEIEIKKGEEESLLVSEIETTRNKTIQFASADANSKCATLEILLENAAMEIDQTKLRVTNGQAVNNEIRKQSSLSTQAKTNFGKNIEMVDCSETIIEKENSTLDALKISKEFKFGESPQSDQKGDQQNFASVPHKYSGASALIINGTPLKKGNLLVQQTLCEVASTNFKLNKQTSGKKTVNKKLDDATLISLRKRTVQKPQCAEKFDKSQAYSVGHEIKEYSALLKKVSMDNSDLVSSDNSGLVSPHMAEDPCVLMPIPGTDPQIYLPKNLENFLYSFLLANEISEKECILQRLESLGGDMRTLTGFDSYEHFDLFFNMLGPLALEMTSKALKSREQLFLVLVKLSGAKSDIEISKALKIGPTSVRIIYDRWEEFMLNQLQSVLGTQKTEWMSGM
uniref:uncharacterized protein LOC120326815 n=1 Tax=Styela clava TaxID=7725 RepID=UPI00193A27B9|nr:uncharacterized protein LOC120326815 [Styela clava]